MKKGIALLLITAMLFSLPVTGLAAQNEETEQNTIVPEAGITPDSWLYGLDNFLKELHLLVTFDVANKASLLDDISGERLAEAREMINENKHEYGLVAMKAYKVALEEAIDVLDEAIVNDKDIEDVLSKFKGSLLTRQELVDTILDEMPEEIRAEIEEVLVGTIDDLEVTIIVTDLEDEEEVDENTDAEGDNDEEQTSEETGQEDDDTVKEDPIKSNEDVDTEEDSDDTVTETEESDDDNDADTKEDSEDESDAEEDKQLVLPLKKLVTVEVLTNKIGEDAARLYALGGLNLRQLLVVSSLAEQTDRSFDEVLDIFLENGRGIGVTAKALQLEPRVALKGIKEVFKGIKCDIKAAFAIAKQEVKAGEKLNEDTVSTDDDLDKVNDPEIGEEKADTGKDDKDYDGRDDDKSDENKGDDKQGHQDRDRDDVESKDKDDEKPSDDDDEKGNKKNNSRKNNSKKNNSKKSNNKNNNNGKANKNNKGNKSYTRINQNKKNSWNKGNYWNKSTNWNKNYKNKSNNGKNP